MLRIGKAFGQTGLKSSFTSEFWFHILSLGPLRRSTYATSKRVTKRPQDFIGYEELVQWALSSTESFNIGFLWSKNCESVVLFDDFWGFSLSKYCNLAIWQEESRWWEWGEGPSGGTWRGCLAGSAPATTERLRVAARAFYHQLSSSTVEHGPLWAERDRPCGKARQEKSFPSSKFAWDWLALPDDFASKADQFTY